MSSTNGVIITDRGKEIIADSIGNGVAIEFTKINIGSGELVSDPEKLEDLIELIMDIDVTSILAEDQIVKMRGNFTNDTITEETIHREIGVYAKTDNLDECLYAYLNNGHGDIIPPIASGKIQRVLDIFSYIGNGGDIIFEIDSSLFATVYDLEDGLNKKENKFDKNSGFNKEKSDSVTTDSSIILATAKAIKTVWDALTSHRNSTSNPHIVTKAQVGLGSVQNYGITDSVTDGSSSKYASAKGVKIVNDKAETKEPKFDKKDGFNSSFSHVINSTSKILVASAYAVKLAFDKGATALTKANSAYTLASGKEPKFTKNSAFNKNKSDAINSNDSNILATSRAVKIAYDKAIECPHGVGDYWITESTTNPATKWTGTTWTKVEGRVLLGTSSGYALGTQGGASTVTLSLANLAGHTHSWNGTTNTTGNHYHQSGSHRHQVDSHAHTQPTHIHDFQIGANNSGDGNHVERAKTPLRIRNDLVKAAGGENTGSSAPYTNYQNSNTSSEGNHNHTISGTTGNSGSGSAFNIMNPYRAVNIWRRTA